MCYCRQSLLLQPLKSRTGAPSTGCLLYKTDLCSVSFRNIDPALESYLFRLFPHFYWSEPALVYESSKAFSPALATRWMAWNLPRSSVGGEESYRELSLWANLVEYTSRTIERWWWDAPTISCFLAVLLIAGYGYTVNQLLRRELQWLYSKLKRSF